VRSAASFHTQTAGKSTQPKHNWVPQKENMAKDDYKRAFSKSEIGQDSKRSLLQANRRIEDCKLTPAQKTAHKIA